MKPLVTLCLLGTLLVGGSCHRYALPSPKGPPQPKLKRGARATDANADGTAAAPAELKPQKNSYDKNGLLKKSKYERRRVQRKVGQRKFLGITLPF